MVELAVVVSPFLPTILWAIILAHLTHPIYLKVRDRFHGRVGCIDDRVETVLLKSTYDVSTIIACRHPAEPSSKHKAL